MLLARPPVTAFFFAIHDRILLCQPLSIARPCDLADSNRARIPASIEMPHNLLPADIAGIFDMGNAERPHSLGPFLFCRHTHCLNQPTTFLEKVGT